MKFLFVFGVLAVAIAVAEGLVCGEDDCVNVECTEVVSESECNTSGGIYKQDATFCGCCPACLKKVALGGICYSEVLIGMPPTSACETGTCEYNGKDWVCTAESETSTTTEQGSATTEKESTTTETESTTTEKESSVTTVNPDAV